MERTSSRPTILGRYAAPLLPVMLAQLPEAALPSEPETLECCPLAVLLQPPLTLAS